MPDEKQGHIVNGQLWLQVDDEHPCTPTIAYNRFYEKFGVPPQHIWYSTDLLFNGAEQKFYKAKGVAVCYDGRIPASSVWVGPVPKVK